MPPTPKPAPVIWGPFLRKLGLLRKEEEGMETDPPPNKTRRHKGGNLTSLNLCKLLTPQQSRYSNLMPAACCQNGRYNIYSGTLDLWGPNKRFNQLRVTVFH
jgi:hypothetical protein